jgi:putative addiction module component (TIGR02574 family)
MSSTADQLEQEIKSLPDIEKLRLVDAILADLDRPDPEIDRIWAEEARKRWDAYKAGRLQTVSYEELMSQVPRPMRIRFLEAAQAVDRPHAC